MSKKVICLALCAMLLALSFPAQAQQKEKVYRIGYLTSRSKARPFWEALRKLGYVGGAKHRHRAAICVRGA